MEGFICLEYYKSKILSVRYFWDSKSFKPDSYSILLHHGKCQLYFKTAGYTPCHSCIYVTKKK